MWEYYQSADEWSRHGQARTRSGLHLWNWRFRQDNHCQRSLWKDCKWILLSSFCLSIPWSWQRGGHQEYISSSSLSLSQRIWHSAANRYTQTIPPRQKVHVLSFVYYGAPTQWMHACTVYISFIMASSKLITHSFRFLEYDHTFS